jgi:hypothetical protein
MDIKETFLRLTSKTYPHGSEDELVPFLPEGTVKDAHGNYYYQIGDTKTIFACHLDTVSRGQGAVKHVFEGNIIKTDGTTILGADDKAGMTILLYMIEHKIPGLYYFFIGEEVGCIGSGKASSDIEFFSKYDRIISFDRRNTHSVITFQSSSRCCSDEFANALCEEFNIWGLNLRPDNTGVYTDSAEFTTVIPECTNISVGYLNEHTFSEQQDIDYLTTLCHACLLVDWGKLPTVRDKTKKESRWGSYSGGGYAYGYDWRDEYDGCEFGFHNDHRVSTDFGFNNRSERDLPPWKTSDEEEEEGYHDWDNNYHETRGSKNNTRRAGRKNTRRRAYLDNLDNELPNELKIYNPFMEDFFESTFTVKELDQLADQYLDVNDQEDMDNYHELYNAAISKNR